MRKPRTTLVFAILACSAVLAGCGGRAYVHEGVDVADFRERAETQSDGPVRVSAAVPGREETEALFGVDLYDQGIQPVWLEIGNSGEMQVRYAPVSTDRYYFSPLEVAYKNRGGFSDEARADMERHFDELAMPRYIDPGETRSGFVFTHADSGAKGFNVDLFSSGDSFLFTFLLRVPGFVPDYANLDPDSIYSGDEIVTYQADELQDALRNLPCCSTDEQGDATGEPINLVLVGMGTELLKALLRSGWVETSAEEAAQQEPSLLFGRPQDAIFRYQTLDGDSVYEMHFWLAPIMSGPDRVWAGQIRHFYTLGRSFRRFDADVDNARNFAIQKFLYGQSLESLAWLSGEQVVPVTSFWDRLINRPYFTDGYRVVLWLSGEPSSVVDIDVKAWDTPPGWKR
ncbi:MAG: LssY C-terminal domain-containing protein [Woeseiaceae bacterium]|nr:LssY C-terminal domain-containing protein [Woeseiaceae bacterium]